MRFNEVSKRYKEVNIATLPMMDHLLNLMGNCLERIVICRDTEEIIEQREQLTKMQNNLFELMAITDQSHEEGRRLFNFYIYLNQCLVKFRIDGNFEQLNIVEESLSEMMLAWQIVKMNRPFTTEL